jgi:hypothetical protein
MRTRLYIAITAAAIVFTALALTTPRVQAGTGGECTPCKKTADCGPKLQCYDGMCKKFKSDKCG